MSSLSETWTQRLVRAFAVDLRSLAALRFALGLMLLVDTLSSLGDVSAFYTDAGVLPRALQQQAVSGWRWSLHLASGGSGFQVLLLLAQAAAALAVALGWRTRLATLIAWALAASLQNRNPLILDSGDTLLCVLLFWTLFLPMAARWSLDAVLSTPPPPVDSRHCSWASVALLLQVLSVFVFQALQQPHDASLYVRDDGIFSLGFWLGWSPTLERWIADAEVVVQLLAPLLLVLRAVGARTTRLQALCYTLLSMAAVSTGALPWMQIIGLLALVDHTFWEHRRRQPVRPLRVYYDRDCGFCLKVCQLLCEMLLVPDVRLLPAQDDRRADSLLRANRSWVVIDSSDTAHLKGAALLLLIQHSPLLHWFGDPAQLTRLHPGADRAYDWMARHRPTLARLSQPWLADRPIRFVPGIGAQRLAGALAVLVLVGNLLGLLAPGSRLASLVSVPLQILRLDQYWDCYWPSPLPVEQRWVAAGHRADGSEVDVLRPTRPLSFESTTAPEDDSDRWIVWRRQMRQNENEGLRVGWADYLCRNWNRALPAASPRALTDFNLIDVTEVSSGEAPHREQHVLARQSCLAPRAP